MGENLKYALLFAKKGFVGREYYWRMRQAGKCPDIVVSVGSMRPRSIVREIERTGGKWNPKAIPDDEDVHEFASLSDPALFKLLRDFEIDIAVQGGVGILKDQLLVAPRIGFVNVHPGRLPQYRGNACPEWALYNGDKVYATAHFIDRGIDTGPIICERLYPIDPGWDYEDFRASLYEHCASVLLEAMDLIEKFGRFRAWDIATIQTAENASYYPPMQADKLKEVRALFNTRTML